MHKNKEAQLSEIKSLGLPDIQGKNDSRNIQIDRVGVKSVKMPIKLLTSAGTSQSMSEKVDMYVALEPECKGTHMSRFLEVFSSYSEKISSTNMCSLASKIKEKLNAPSAEVIVSFTYFQRKLAPVTGSEGFIDYEITLAAKTSPEPTCFIEVSAPATSLCPCSKEISKYGAHNQRCRINANVRGSENIEIDDLIRHIEQASSCEVYSTLKRPDEKYVTEKAYENPKFVEDIVRDLAILLNNDARIHWYKISSENEESIHSHNAYAEIEHTKSNV